MPSLSSKGKYITELDGERVTGFAGELDDLVNFTVVDNEDLATERALHRLRLLVTKLNRSLGRPGYRIRWIGLE